jgi:hypothetical protein
LFAGAVVTAIFAILAFRKQSEEVSTLKQQALDQQELIRQQSELLKVQSARLDLEREQLEQQRLAPRFTGWEAAVRELSLFLGRERHAIRNACSYFPVDSNEKDPPELMALIEDRDALRRICMDLLGMLGVLPREIAKKVLPVTVELVEADAEITALVLAMAEAMEELCTEGQTTWQWADAERIHTASGDPGASGGMDRCGSGTACQGLGGGVGATGFRRAGLLARIELRRPAKRSELLTE